MSKQKRLTDAEIDAMIPAAREHARKARAMGLRATKALYDPVGKLVLLNLSNGALVGIPVAKIPYLAKTTAEERKGVTLLPTGNGVRWASLDVDLSVEDLLFDTFGKESFTRFFGRLGGQATSAAKARSSRANGAKGGRPRKHAA